MEKDKLPSKIGQWSTDGDKGLESIFPSGSCGLVLLW
jgi:hypothetical protein